MSAFYAEEILQDVNSRLDIRRLMQSIDYRFEKYQENPKTGKGFCPIHREGLFRNLVIDMESRTFRCQYTQCPGSKGGSLVSLYAQALSIDIDKAVRTIVKEQELPVDLPIDDKLIAAELVLAEQELEAGSLDAAETRYNQLLELDANNSDTHHGLLKIYESREDTEKYNEKLVAVCKLKIAEGKAGEIPDLIQAWSELDADSPEARFACAELLFARGDAESAVMEFMGGGDACEGRGDLDGALHAYKRAAAISSEHKIDMIDVTPHVVRVLTQAEKAPEAVQYLAELAEQAVTNGNLDSAAELFLMAIEVDPDQPSNHRRFLETAAMIPPTSIISHHVIASATYLNDHEEHDFAINSLENFLVVAPEDENAIQALINLYNNHGHADSAFNLEARLADLLHSRGEVEESREIVDRVLTWQPQHVPMLEVLSKIQLAEDHPAESRETRRRLVRAWLAQKQYTAALDEIAALTTADADGEDLLDLRGTALEGLVHGGDAGSRDAAVKALEELADRHLELTTGRRAIGYLQRAIDLVEEPPNTLLFKMARAYLRNKDYTHVRDTVISACENLAGSDRLDEAILEAERYSNLIPQDTDLVRYLVELYLRFDDKPAAIARMRRLAEELLRTGRSEEADEVMEQANELEPQNLENLTRQIAAYREAGQADKVGQALLRLASYHEQQEAFTDAAAVLEEYLKSQPDDSAVIMRLVQLYDKLKNETAARQWRLQLARVYRNSSDGDREARALRDILAQFPDDEEALHMLMNAEFNRADMQAGVTIALRLATLQQKNKKAEASRKTLLKAVERVPENLEINREIYRLYLNGHQPNQAISWGKKLVSILKTSGKNADAAVIFDEIVDLDSENLALKQEQLRFLEETGRDTDVAEKRLKLAKIYRQQERFSDAESMLEEVIKLDPRNISARRSLAEQYLHLGQNVSAETQLLRIAGIQHMEGESPEAVEVLRQVLLANPSNSEARRQLAQIYRAEGDDNAAVTELLELADAYRKQDMEVEAIATEREALELDPSNIEIGRRVVNSLKSAGRTALAADQLHAIAGQLINQQKPKDALAIYDEILELDPERLSARKHRADLLVKMGKAEQAMEELRTLAEMALNGNAKPETQEADASGGPGAEERPSLQLVPEYTFEQFVVGANNDFAYATALAIARSPARAYNPLFLYANVGLGKTHLCNAIANHLLEHEPRAKIIYTNSEDFTDELVDAIQNNAVQTFRTRYRSLDLLIVDDVQFLAGKERAQEEFFHIFNNLFQAKRQIVITSDRPPAEIAHLENRLRSRFGAGVIVDIASPDLETRLAILSREITDDKLNLESWIPRLLAERIDSNVRDLKGALNQVIALRDLRKQELTEANIGQMIETCYPTAAV